MCKIIACFSGPANVLIPKTPPAHTSFSLNVLQAQNDSTSSVRTHHMITPPRSAAGPQAAKLLHLLFCAGQHQETWMLLCLCTLTPHQLQVTLGPRGRGALALLLSCKK